jgi:hypothetical protein
MRPAVTIVAILLITAAMAPFDFAADSSLARTQVKLLTPYSFGRISSGLNATEKASGSCFAESVASSSRPDAWRCMAGNAIMDPCFQNVMGDPKVLACIRDPWSNNLVVLNLTAPLPNDRRKDVDRNTTLPWAIELATGQHCSLFTGATAPIAGMRINYGCPGGWNVVGDIDRSQPVWRVFAQGENSSVLEQVDIAVAWF